MFKFPNCSFLSEKHTNTKRDFQKHKNPAVLCWNWNLCSLLHEKTDNAAVQTRCKKTYLCSLPHDILKLMGVIQQTTSGGATLINVKSASISQPSPSPSYWENKEKHLNRFQIVSANAKSGEEKDDCAMQAAVIPETSSSRTSLAEACIELSIVRTVKSFLLCPVS